MASRSAALVALVCFGCAPRVAGDPDPEMGSTSGADATGPDASTSDVPLPTTTSAATTTPTTTGEDESTGEPSTGSESSSSGEPFDPLCDARCESLVDGSCVAFEDCPATCQTTVGDQGEAVADAFEFCVSSQPLCFSFLEDCMWAELYGDTPVDQLYTLEGTGFGAWEGRTVYSRLLAGAETLEGSTGTVADGGFSVDATFAAPFDAFSNSRTFYFFVDVDEDGACTSADYVQSAWTASLHADFAEPAFVLETTPDGESNEGLCSQF